MNRGCRQVLEKQGHQLPARAVLRPDGLYLALRDIPAAELRDAFMQETVTRVPAAESFVHIAREDLGKVAIDSAPAGIVFHVARCGSTLISQLLKQHEGCVVYAEPLPVNELLLPPHSYPRHELVASLRSLGNAFARHAGKPYVLKLSSWNTLFCDLVAEAFPSAPWALSVRDPIEVGVSVLAQPPGWMQGNAGASGVLRSHVDPTGASSSPAEFAARLYGAFCETAARLDARRGKLIRYEALPGAVWEMLAPHFSLPVDDALRQRMAQAARVNAKAPIGKTTAFANDSATKQAAATVELRESVALFAQPALQRLEHHLRAQEEP
jgi:hypothetical protein